LLHRSSSSLFGAYLAAWHRPGGPHLPPGQTLQRTRPGGGGSLACVPRRSRRRKIRERGIRNAGEQSDRENTAHLWIAVPSTCVASPRCSSFEETCQIAVPGSAPGGASDRGNAGKIQGPRLLLSPENNEPGQVLQMAKRTHARAGGSGRKGCHCAGESALSSGSNHTTVTEKTQCNCGLQAVCLKRAGRAMVSSP